MTIGSFFLGIDMSLRINDLHIKDKRNNTLLSAGELRVSVYPLGIDKALDLGKVQMSDFDVSLVQYSGDSALNYQFIADFFAGDGTSDSTVAKLYPVTVQNLLLDNGKFVYQIEESTSDSIVGMDYNNLVINEIMLDARDVLLLGDSVNASIRALKAREKSGLELRNLKAELKMGAHGLQAGDFKLVTEKSAVHMDLDLHYSGYGDFIEFIDSVQIQAAVQPSTLDLSEIGAFAAIMYEMPDVVSFAGNVEGTVADFEANEMSFSFGESTSFLGDISMRGLPDFFTSDILLNVHRFETNAADIESFAIPIEGRYLQLPSIFNALGQLRVDGRFEGKYEDFKANSFVQTEIGKLKADLIYRLNPRTGLPHYSATVVTTDLDLGILLDQNALLGKLNLDARLRGSGLTPQTADARLVSNIRSIGLQNNVFENIEITAEIADSFAELGFSVLEPEIGLEFLATVDLKQEQPFFYIDALLHNSDLHRLNIIDGDSISQLATNLHAKFSGLNPDTFSGEISLSDLDYRTSSGEIKVKALKLSVMDDAYLGRKLLVASDFFDFEMGGMFQLSTIVSSFKSYLNHYMAFKMLEKPIEISESVEQDFYFNLKFKNFNPVLAFLFPTMTMANQTSLSGVFTQRNHTLNTTFRSEWIRLGEILFEAPYLLIQSDEQDARLDFEMKDLILKKASSEDVIDFGMQSPKLSLNAASDSLNFKLSWDNQRENMLNKGLVNGLYFLDQRKDGNLSLAFNEVIVNDSVLKLSPGNLIQFREDVTRIEKFNLQLGKSQLGLQGSIPLREEDSLIVSFNEWNISAFDVLTGTAGFDLDGVINGDLVLSNIVNNPYFSSNLHINGLGLNNERIGEARLLSNWSNLDKSIYANVQIINTGNRSNSRVLNLRGFYYPTREKDNLSIDLTLENFRLKFLNQFFEGIISQLEGIASGEFTIRGEINKPVIKGSLELLRTAFLIDYLNVKYSLQHKVDVKPGLIPIENLIMFDSAGNQATVNGTITNNYLTDWAFDLKIKPSTLLALNTGPKQNELFYGSAVATGDVLIKGPLENIEMGITALTNKGTAIVIPLNTAGSVGSSDFIRFVNTARYDAADSMTYFTKPIVGSGTGFNINLNAEITPDASVKIFLPYDMGTLEATGSGNLALGVNNSGAFTLNGDYFVRDGLFTFTFENLLKKRFSLMEGGRITWTGDPYEADLDVKGVYRVKASLAGLGIDTTSSLRNRINVDCIIHLTNGLFNPDIGFSFALPGADADIEQKVFSVIDTTNDAAMTQQMVSLLVLGSFASTNLGNSSLTNSTFEMISGQLSGLLSQISKDFDIGLNYRPGDALTNEELEVALSTQLFNDRVSIEGNFGVSNNKNVSQSASNIVGDVDVSVKLNADGSFRLRAFNHSNHSSWLSYGVFDNYSPYTQGIGISYRQEFDAFNEIFRRKKTKIKK